MNTHRPTRRHHIVLCTLGAINCCAVCLSLLATTTNIARLTIEMCSYIEFIPTNAIVTVCAVSHIEAIRALHKNQIQTRTKLTNNFRDLFILSFTLIQSSAKLCNHWSSLTKLFLSEMKVIFFVILMLMQYSPNYSTLRMCSVYFKNK